MPLSNILVQHRLEHVRNQVISPFHVRYLVYAANFGEGFAFRNSDFFSLDKKSPVRPKLLKFLGTFILAIAIIGDPEIA